VASNAGAFVYVSGIGDLSVKLNGECVVVEIEAKQGLTGIDRIHRIKKRR
jgi:hypothetical protein